MGLSQKLSLRQVNNTLIYFHQDRKTKIVLRRGGLFQWKNLFRSRIDNYINIFLYDMIFKEVTFKNFTDEREKRYWTIAGRDEG